MPIVIVNGKEIEIAEGERLNGIQVAARAGVEVPYYCWHPGMSVVASCRMCMMETGKLDRATGKIAMVPKIVPGCQTPATPDTVFITDSDKVKAARAMVEEDLLIRHPIDCPICDKAGECKLQDYHFEHGQDKRRADLKPFTSRRRELGDTITLFVDRCVMCTRCVRFTREISGTSELMVINRGAHEEIDVFRDAKGEAMFPLENKMSGNVADICPVGALGDRDFLYQQRVWFMKSHDNVCAGCSTGCSIKVEENQDQIYRLKPRENPHINQWWMCDDGRYGWKHVHADNRLTEPKKKVGGEYKNVEWPEVIEAVDKDMRAAGKLAGAISPHLTVEEAYLLGTYLRSIDPEATLALGPIPMEGTDERFPSGFTIRAEKCPNKRGVEKVLAGLGGNVVDFETLSNSAASGTFSGIWISGGYKHDWNDAALAEKFAGAKTLVVQDCFATPLYNAATWQLPGGTFAERDGSYVNFNDRLQSFRWAVRAPGGVRVEGQLYWHLLQKPGLFRSQAVLEDLSRENLQFSAAMSGVPDVGIDLKVNQLASAPAGATA